jgi:hypothetical protein
MESSFSSSRSVSERIVAAVAAHADADPLELPPLHEAIDSDAVDDLFHDGSSGSVRFRYAGRTVTVDSEGRVDVAQRPVGDCESATSSADD